MARLELPDAASMSAEQRDVHDEAAAGLRGRAPAPLTAWIRHPELARRAQRLGELMRYGSALPPHLSELAILVTARHWTSHYEWKIHKEAALKAGLAASAIAAIAADTTPEFDDEKATIVYQVSTTLLRQHRLDDALYRAGIDALGERAMVDLVGVLGYYGLVSMTLNCFEIGLPDAFQPELAEPGDR